ncbi:MAG TPA: hypothetical protein VHC18_10980 [Amycolatopsis sp.]|nr:hypothetical protein [Amycolatopsis sp.]
MRLAPQPSRVADDIRAALSSLGRGTEVAGGIALVGVRPLPSPQTFDAVLVLPRGVLVVLGVDLPEPVMRLEAPLTGPWKADGWPLSAADEAVNPATTKLALARSLRKRLDSVHSPIGTVLAIGPFVDKVDQPAADVAGMVRVLHPTATSMLAAVVSLAVAPKACAVEDARALIKLLAPDAEITDEMLTAEGFAAEASTVTLPQVAADPAKPAVRQAPADMAESQTPGDLPRPVPPPGPIEITAPVPRVTATAPVRSSAPAQPSRTVRWLPVGAIGLLAVLLVTAIVLATTGSGDKPAASAPPPPPQVVVNGIQFVQRASATDAECAAHAFGDVQASLLSTGCVAIRRGSYEATVQNRPAAVTLAVITFANEDAASAFKQVVDTPGGGGMADLATETGKWAHTPSFDGAAYVSTTQGTVVRLVLAAWLDGRSSSMDPGLLNLARAAAAMPLS